MSTRCSLRGWKCLRTGSGNKTQKPQTEFGAERTKVKGYKITVTKSRGLIWETDSRIA